MKKILLSGVKPTNRPHLGNYFGAMRQFVDLQEEYQAIIMIADYHAMTTIKNREELSQNIIDMALDYLAIGLDPKKTIIFKQSDVGVHAELTWVFDTLISLPFLKRAHAYKDAKAKNKEISVGTFNYPVLMASDILLYDTDIVPVGQDQKQHIEYTRDIALKFNNQYGELFKIPEELIIKDVGIIPGTDGQKMSKSYKNSIPLFGTDEEIRKIVMSIITDSKGAKEPKDPENCIIFSLHKLFLDQENLSLLKSRYLSGNISYKESKELLVDEIINFIKPMRERREELSRDMEGVRKILKEGGEKAKKIAEKKMEEAKELIGLKI